MLGPGGHDPGARAAAAQQCADPYPATRDPAEPLDRPTPRASNPLNVFAQVEKIFCHNMAADPGTIPIITTYLLYQAGYCETSRCHGSTRPGPSGSPAR